ncbi:hypothetical protein CU098_009552 [Rhizopus stolonifer]|uniref:Uncharacterized protein n=1 Tax=Rhizopus stolonifer TaxID=4846 RepID=A0A367KNL9_RHIST|nr:hypothetical protein CU098_009552 [Rhizopus stolonifer]
MSRQPVDNNHESSEYEEDDDDSEYEDIEITSWGDNVKSEPATWDSLIDHSTKVKAGGIGNGDLHRRGANFKPVSEDFILAQRLKKPIPSALGGKKPKKKSKKKPKDTTPFSNTTRATAPIVRHSNADRPYVPITHKPMAQRAAPINSVWGMANLSSEPFWEQKKPQSFPPPAQKQKPIAQSRARLPATSEIKPSNPQISTQHQEQRLIAQPTPPNSLMKGKWSLDAEEFKPKSAPPSNLQSPSSAIIPSSSAHQMSAFASNFSPPPSPFTPNASVQSTPLNVQAKPFDPLFQLPVSKPVKVSTPPAPNEPASAPPTSTATASNTSTLSVKPRVKLDKSLITKHLLSKPAQDTVPWFRIELAIADGISTTISVFKDSDPKQIAEEFGHKHNLNVTEKAKEGIANRITQLMNNMKKQQ